MTTHMSKLLCLGILLAGGVGLVACSDDSTSCPQGTYGCRCYPNHTCNYGLGCEADNRCRGPSPCDDDRECVARHQECLVTEGVAACGACLDGFEDQDGVCVPVRCVAGACSGHGECSEDSDAVTCACETGWAGQYCDTCDEAAGYHLADDGVTCTEDPCDPNPCGDSQTCVPTTGECVCPLGTCVIGKNCIAAGAQDPDHGCRVCDPDRNPHDWTIGDEGTICRQSAGDCDPAETCDGQSPDCPDDALAEPGSACGSTLASVCDHPDTCDDQGVCQPNYEPATSVCRPASGPCDKEDLCNGAGLCPDEVLAEGSACDDGDDCTADDQCDGLGADESHCFGRAYTCSDHGDCNASDDGCTCAMGYSGDHCDHCALDWQDNDGDGICRRACSNPDLPSCPEGTGPCDDSVGVPACLTPGYVALPAGSFTMGTEAGGSGYQPDERAHRVTLSGPLEVKVVEVTQAEWRAAIEAISLFFVQYFQSPPDAFGTAPSYHDCDDCPVERVSWIEAVLFADFVSSLGGLSPCYLLGDFSGMLGMGDGCDSGPGCDAGGSIEVIYDPSCTGYRLPTEAEWEYVARAGSQTPFYPVAGTTGALTDPGCADPSLAVIGWYCGNAAGATRPVASRAPNAFGLYDMSGNVFEWTWDLYTDDLGSAPVQDPLGPDSGVNRVIRGALSIRRPGGVVPPPDSRLRPRNGASTLASVWCALWTRMVTAWARVWTTARGSRTPIRQTPCTSGWERYVLPL